MDATFSRKKSLKFADFLGMKSTDNKLIKRFLSNNRKLPKFFRIRSLNNSVQFFETVSGYEVQYNPKGYWYVVFDDRKFRIPSLKENGHHYDISYLKRKEIVSLWNRLPFSSFAPVIKHMNMFHVGPDDVSFFRIKLE